MLLFPAALMVLSFGPWLEARSFVHTASSAVARQIAVRGSDSGAEVAIETMAANSGIPSSAVSAEICGGGLAPLGTVTSMCMPLARSATVTVTVAVNVPLFSGPWGDIGGVQVSGTHTEFTDPYRAMP